MTSGIYTITAPSGGQYAGSAVNLRSRWNVHWHLLSKSIHHNRGLQRACQKYGLESLVFKKLLICRPADLLMFEQRAIDILKPRYNACPIAGSQLGRKHRPESNAKNSASKLGKKIHSAEHRAALAERMRGNKFMTGKLLSLATKQKMGTSLRGRPHKDGFESRATPDQRSAIAREYCSGVGQLALASKWKTSHKVIKRILVAAGVVISPSGHAIKRRSR